MSENFNPRERVVTGPDGTYITVSQMQFYLNREDGLKNFEEVDDDFLEYFNLCRVYNLVSDTMTVDPDAAIMYWDDQKKVISLGFPETGKIAKKLSRMKNVKAFIFEEDDDDEGFGKGIFNDLDWDDE